MPVRFRPLNFKQSILIVVTLFICGTASAADTCAQLFSQTLTGSHTSHRMAADFLSSRSDLGSDLLFLTESATPRSLLIEPTQSKGSWLERISNSLQRGRQDGNPTIRLSRKARDESPQNIPASGRRGFFSEHARMYAGENLALNRVILALQAEGGEVRALDKRDFSGQPVEEAWGVSYFRLSTTGRPILALESKIANDLLQHELQHFYDWLGVKNHFLNRGLSLDVALVHAKSYFESGDPELVRQTERRAITSEFRTNQKTMTSPDTIERLVYPEMSAIFQIIKNQFKVSRSLSVESQKQADAYMDQAIRIAIEVQTLSGSASDDRLLAVEMGISSNPILMTIFQRRINRF